MPTRQIVIGFLMLLAIGMAGTFVIHSEKRRLRGICDLRWSMVAGMVGLLCMLLRGLVPVLFVSVCGEAALLTGFAFLHRALARAIDRPARLLPFFPILLALFTGGLFYFSIANNNLDGRITVAMLGTAAMLAWTLRLTAQPVKGGLIIPMRWMYRLLILAVALRMVRILLTFAFDPNPNLQVLDPLQALMVYTLLLAAVAQAAGTFWVSVCAHQEDERVRADTDGLTGLLNRRAFEEMLARQLSQPRTQTAEVSLMLVDLDFFKDMNDGFGHLAGDEVLRRVSGVLRRCVRSVDALARFGGDEFAVLLCSSELGQGMIVAERVRQSLIQMRGLPGGRKVTASLGVATAFPGDTPLLLIERADRALYRSKNLGRNRLTHFEDEESQGDDNPFASVLIN